MSAVNLSTLDPNGTFDPARLQRDFAHLKSGYKSWRKKYRKLKLQFDEKMRESNTYFIEQHKALRVARRLQEQNDQLLELLLDINSCKKIPPNLRYELNVDSADSHMDESSDAEKHNQLELHRALREARANYDSGYISQEEYSNIETDLVAKLSAPSVTKLSSLLSTPHTPYIAQGIPEDLLEDSPIGYLTPTHEEEYISVLDSTLHDGSEAYRNISRTAPQPPPRGLTEKDLALQNPNSIYHWLKKYQPQVFTQDREGETMVEKPASRGKKVSSKRGGDLPLGNTSGFRDPDVFEDDYLYIPEPPKSKRTKDDEAYRPKGGSGKSSKRKREDGEKNSNKKKAKSSGVGIGSENETTSRPLVGEDAR